MDGEKLFKSALGGFNKDDVMQYINDMNKKAVQLQAENNKLTGQYDKLLLEMEELKKSSSAANEVMLQAERELEGKKERLSFVEARHVELQRSFETVSKSREVLSQDNVSLTERNALLEKRCNDYESRARIFDSSAREIADVMVKARKDAGDIVEEANCQAVLRRAQVDKELHKALEDYAMFKSKITALKGQALSVLSDAANRVTMMDSFLTEIEEECAFPNSTEKDDADQ